MKKFSASEDYLARAERTIPLGSQTFSKSRTQFPFGVSPYFVTHGRGSRVWDVDGNEYIDFVNGLAAITLGYNDEEVNEAVRRQLELGVIFSLPHPLEAEVAELICDMVPCAEMVRFGKNGSDATSGAIRLARAHTNRDRVAVCGYHGWQDWYIGSTSRNRGVPQATRDLTHTFAYNEPEPLRELLERHQGEFAAVILEPMNAIEPKPGFLERVKELAHAHGALLVFDETITGFRYSNAGAQGFFGVTPDLATFGKGLANGFPISAVAGPRQLMRLMEEIFFSFTFGGETLSLAAAKATLLKLRREPVTQRIAAKGSRCRGAIDDQIRSYGLTETFSVSGHPSWLFFNIRDSHGRSSLEIKTLYLQEMFAQGILTIGTFNLSDAHTDEDIDALVAAHDRFLRIVADALRSGTLDGVLRCAPLQPLFKVR
ncbi:MAG: aminotransferase class III-fold pyridoxal phosphate-dependent enzyme [Steroidobacteraceae bacterium]